MLLTADYLSSNGQDANMKIMIQEDASNDIEKSKQQSDGGGYMVKTHLATALGEGAGGAGGGGNEISFGCLRCVSGFNEQAWDHVCQEFNKETGLNYDKMELKKQVSFLRKRYRIMKPLYKHGGFGWDYRRKMVDVDDGVWAENIEVYPEIIPYRKWGCPLYDDFMHHITKPLATGEYAISSSQIDYVSSNPPRRATVNQKGSTKCRRAEVLNSCPNMGNYKDVGNSEVSAAQGTNLMPQCDDDPHSASCCVAIISGMQGVHRRLYNGALDLFQNACWRKTFIILKNEKRLTWLKAMPPGTA